MWHTFITDPICLLQKVLACPVFTGTRFRRDRMSINVPRSFFFWLPDSYNALKSHLRHWFEFVYRKAWLRIANGDRYTIYFCFSKTNLAELRCLFYGLISPSPYRRLSSLIRNPNSPVFSFCPLAYSVRAIPGPHGNQWLIISCKHLLPLLISLIGLQNNTLSRSPQSLAMRPFLSHFRHNSLFAVIVFFRRFKR